MKRISIAKKVLLLAGVPVLGALVLAGLLVHGVSRQAASAAAFGSVENVAQLSARISVAIHSLQNERASVCRTQGTAEAPGAPTWARAAASRPLAPRFVETDAALDDLDRFLRARDASRLLPRLTRDLGTARDRLADRDVFRRRLSDGGVGLDEAMAFYDEPIDALIGATSALTQLSNDGELLRAISSLVALAERTERGSRQQGLLAYVFAATQFPPGSFKTLVTLVTEEAVYADAFRSNAADLQVRQYELAEQSEDARAALVLREKALSTTEDVLDLDPNEWFAREGAHLDRLRGIEDDILGAIGSAAAEKMHATRWSIFSTVGLHGPRDRAARGARCGVQRGGRPRNPSLDRDTGPRSD
jgi:two-component system, chemotaxis family, sensor kinase CheA